MANSLLGRLMVGLGLDSSGLDKGSKKSLNKLSAFQRSTESISKGINRSLLRIGAGFAIGSIVNNAARTVANFDQKIADLASITGKSRDQMDGLVENAKQIGAISAFSASQVLDLQTSLSKLGNTEQEIISMTKSVGDFSIAVGATTEEAATFTGGALKSFGLRAEDTTATLNTLALATTKSALDFNKLNTAIPIVGTAADQSGIGINRLTALLGVLADRNIDASTSGTALRNIFLELKSRGLTYEQAMAQINGSTDKLNEANKLFGKRGAVVATVLAESATAADTLEASISNANGALEKMTNERLNTLQGKLTLTKSAWEGLVLSVESGDGIISSAFKSVADTSTGILTGLTQLNKGGLSLGNFLHLVYGSDEVRKNVISDLEKTRKIQDEIASGARNDEGGLRSQRGGGLGDLRNFGKKKDDTLSSEIEKLNSKTKETKKTTLSLSQEISKLESNIVSLSEAYIKGGESNKNILTSITDKQAKIVSLNSELEKSISLVNQLQRGDQSISAPQSIGSISAPNQIESQSATPVTLSDGFLEKAKRDTEALNLANDELATSYASLGQAIGDSLGQGANSFKEFATQALSSIQRTIGGLLKLFIAKSLASSIGAGPFGLFAAAALGGLAEGIFNTAINSAKIPAVAKGGVFREPRVVQIGEYAGASSNPEIATPESLMARVFRTELSRNGAGQRMYSVTKGSDIYISQEKYNYRISRTG